MATSERFEVAQFLADATLEQVRQWQSVNDELALHCPEIPMSRREYVASQIIRRIWSDAAYGR